MSQSYFITLEGTEGVGKSTQCSLLADALRRDFNFEVELTREPGGTALGESVRAILLDPNLPPMDGTAELLLMFAARAEHLARVIKPNLAMGRWVICDRFTDATYAYQGGGRSLDRNSIAALEALVQKGFAPNLTLVLDLDVNLAMQRIAQRGKPDRFELEQRSFFERVRESYLQLAAAFPNRIVVVDATPPEAVVHTAIMAIVREQLL